ncbi:threonylcarbamoyl-AMP synthase isoform X2 [Pseudopipra pipra]|uniref:threonylcarbamoyl-AMP synthase isoform X2 n=1 Tax=Pseudopipra pipra TaxID=415032 RepID=UPI003138E6B8
MRHQQSDTDRAPRLRRCRRYQSLGSPGTARALPEPQAEQSPRSLGEASISRGSSGPCGPRARAQRRPQRGHRRRQLLAGGDAGPQLPLPQLQQLPQPPRLLRNLRGNTAGDGGHGTPAPALPRSPRRSPVTPVPSAPAALPPPPPRPRAAPAARRWPWERRARPAPALALSPGAALGSARMARAARALARAAEGAAGPGLGRARLVPLPPGGAAGPDPHGWREAVAAAAGALQAGGLVAVPTDTVYGVACLAQDSAAVRSIYSLKGRNGAKPLAICLGDVERLYRYCHVNVPDELLRDLLPGPVTLVLQRSEELNKDLNPFTSLVGVRIPDHSFMRDLARACSGPLALTSANISSQGSTLTVSLSCRNSRTCGLSCP